VGVYAPDEGTPASTKDKSEITLREIIVQTPKKHELIITGNLNGKAGKQHGSPVVGPYG
jgi:hypothetical protein